MLEEKPRKPEQPREDQPKEPKIRPDWMDHLEKGAKIGESREADKEE
jgi:hypothetical protein